MKVLMIAPTPFFSDRGCHVRILEEARALRAAGHQVRIVTYHLGRDMEDIPTDRIMRIPWYGKLSAGPSWHKPYMDLFLFFKALSAARRFRPDLIHAHLHEGAFIGLFLKKLLRRPLVFDCQGSLTAELLDHQFVKKGSLLFRIFFALEKRINRWVDHIITSSTPTAELLLEDFGLSPGKVTPLVDGVDTDVFRPVGDVEAVRRELELPEGKRVVVFLGAMSAYQGVDLLLDSIALLKKRRDDVHFLLMGYPEEKYQIKAGTMGIADCITFTGRVDYRRAPRYLSIGDLAVSPKLASTEANGKLFNYMACGLPCVVFDTPVNREILGDTGVYADYGEAGDLAIRVESVLDDRARLEELSRAVRDRVEWEHSWLKRAEEIAAVYRQV